MEENTEDEKAALMALISSLEANQTALLQEKEKMEEDFGLQRAKLKDLYLQKEEELRVKNEESLEDVLQIEKLQTQLCQLQFELEESRSQVIIAQCTAENEVAVERRKCEEEIASVQRIMQEEIANTEEEIKDLRTLAKKCENEKIHYRELYEKSLLECDLKRDSLLSPGVLSAVTKSFAKHVPSLSPAHNNLIPPDKLPISGSLGQSLNVSDTVTTPNNGDLVENLEESMRKAQEDATVLRSLVEPLEEEIHALKNKIREQDAQLRAHESQEQMDIRTSDVLAPLFQGKSAEELVQELDKKLQGVKNTLEVEKASRADLELYTAILNAQKTALTDNIERIRKQQIELRQLYDEERKEHNELKNTWQRANDQFLVAQRMQLADVRRIRSLLTVQQLQKFYDLQRADSKDEKSPTTKAAELDFNDGENSTDYISQSHVKIKKGDSSETVSTLLDSSESPDDDDISNLGKKDDADCSKGSTNVLISKYSPEKMPQLTDDQKRALSGLEGEKYVEVNESGHVSLLELPSNHLVVSEIEWKKLQEEIKRSRLWVADSCPLCIKLEGRLKKVESEFKESEKRNAQLEKAIARQTEDLERECLYRKQTEKQWKQKVEEYDNKEKTLQFVIERITALHSRVIDWSKKTVQAMEEKLKTVTEKREATQKELIRLQNENDNLIGKHSQYSQEMQNEIINLPDSMEEMQLLLLKYREDVIAAKVAKEHIEEKYNSELLFLKDQILQEQHERTTMEDRLNADIDQYRKKVSTLEMIEAQLKTETQLRSDIETRFKEMDQKAQDANRRSQQMISGLKQNLDDQNKLKSQEEREHLELKSRVTSLQHDLEMSEAVQRDFVRLSQSLQVQLEKIRQSEKEVRWQHEEDIEDCSNCKQRFTAVGRRKHHCKHCGKIFCSECVTKIVLSGPSSRPSRVCDVCHTLLVQDATPFFSTEPPLSPD